MQLLDYLLLDVFTDKPFTGNPLAVVLYPEPALSTAAMQVIAGEFNLSETVFVYKDRNLKHDAALRIFTSTFELPFAGHPTVGAAVALGILAQRQGQSAPGPANLLLQEAIGTVAVELNMLEEGYGNATFDVPRLSVGYECPLPPSEVAAILRVETSALTPDAQWPKNLYSAGNSMLFARLNTRADVDRVAIDTARYEQHALRVGESTRHPFIYVFCYDATESTEIYARMLSVEAGIVEDPATGSAVAALAGYLYDREQHAEGRRSWTIHQGVAMGRPSVLQLAYDATQGKVTRASVGGHAVLVGEGKIRRPNL